ncbi:DNA replication initiation factor cdc45 [Saitoella coloradoensis]
MGFITRGDFGNAYQKIKSVSISGSCPVLLFVSLDADALCACKMLSDMLKADYVPHEIHPVTGWDDLSVAREKLIENNLDLRYIFMLGFGNTMDLCDLFPVRAEVVVYVIDSHRPYNLANLFGEHDNIKVFDDGEVAELDTEKRAMQALFDMEKEGLLGENGELSDTDDEDEEDSEDDDDRDDGGDNGAGEEEEPVSSNGKRKSPSADSDQDEDDPADESDSAEPPRQRRKTSPTTSAPATPQKKTGNPRKELRRVYRKNLTKVSEYYGRGSWFGEGAAALVFSMASDLGREDNEMLWCGIVALAYQQTHGRVKSDEQYDQYYLHYRDEVQRLNPPNLSHGSRGRLGSKRSASDTSIRTEQEFRFMMVRHWSLYDAMLHSPYLATRLQIWDETGIRRFHKMLAKMGFSLQQCRQTYTHMDVDLKRALKDTLQKVSPVYGLDDVEYPSFVREWGYKCTLSASDAAYALSALLEAGKGGVKNPLANGGPKHNENASNNPTEKRDEEEAAQEESWIRHFWDAWDALSSVDALRKALTTAMDLQRAIVRTGTSIIDKRGIKRLQSFRMAVVREGPDVSILGHPGALTKLALWVAEAINEQEKEHGRVNTLPFVIALLNEATDSFLVVGTDTVTPNSPVGARQNKFGNAFQEVSQSNAARSRLKGFEASVVEVRREDVGPFFEQLSMHALR